MSAILPPRCLQASLVSSNPSASWTLDDGTGDPYIGFPYQWTVQVSIQPQSHSSPDTPTPYEYTATDIQVGDWLVQSSSGFMLQIISISNTTTQTTLNCTIEDVDRYNIFTDPNQGGSGIGSNSPSGNFDCFIISLDSNGLPIYTNLNTGFVPEFLIPSINSRFQSRNQNSDYVEVYQSGNTFAVGNPIYLTSGGAYSLATAVSSTVQNTIGFVSSINTPGPGYFTFTPVGRIIGYNLSSIGNLGDLLYIGSTGALTNTAPANNSKPVMIKLSNTQGVAIFGSGAQNITVTGDVTGSGSSAITLTLASIGTAGTYGSGSAIPSVTVNAKGQVIGASTSPITLPTVGTAGTYGSATSIPIITTDTYGRVTNVTSAPITSGQVVKNIEIDPTSVGQTTFVLPAGSQEVLTMSVNGIELKQNTEFSFNQSTVTVTINTTAMGYTLDTTDEVLFLYV